MTSLKLLSAGAAKGVVEALQEEFETGTRARLESAFGAVGSIRERLIAEACDVVILTAAMIDQLSINGIVEANTSAPIGRVNCGVAVRAGVQHPTIDSGDALRRALLGADVLYSPDMGRSTAGAHFGGVLARLGIRGAVASRLKEFPSGAAAMQALAASQGVAMGCTQVTEILHTPGVDVAGTLPAGFELTTVYSAAVSTQTETPALARALVHLLTGSATIDVRRANGFDVQ